MAENPRLPRTPDEDVQGGGVENPRLPRVPDGEGEGSGGSGGGGKRKKPFAVRQAEREVREAERELEAAKESGSGERISAARKALREAEKAREGLRGDTGEERREARQEFMQDYYDTLGPYVAQLMKEDPELRDLIQEAIRKGWNAVTFERELKRTDWWQDEKKTNTWLDAFKQEFGDDPGGQWADTLDGAKDNVLDFAARYGLTLDDGVVERIARRAIYEGWSEREFQEWMAERTRAGVRQDSYEAGGTIESTERTLRNFARDFGLQYSDDWFTRRAININDPSKRYTQEDFVNEMIEQAESLYPVFAGRLSAEYTVRDAAGSYLSQMANLLELPDPSQIDLNDPLLKKAFGSAMDEKGQPKLMSLWDFQKEVRMDDRWQTTANAYQTYTSIGTGLARMMGFTG